MKLNIAPIHQMYCTHCTFGTSALERREGEIGQRVLGYSARASSMDREELRKNYRLVERYLYYSLPSDSPPEEKLRLTAESAPRRFVFFPSIGGMQVLGQLSYRQKDTSRNERVGSYFAHLLMGDRAKPWSVLESLKLWGAPWVGEDSEKLPFDLDPLPKLNSLIAGSRGAIDDAVLTSFVSTPPGKPFDDPKGVIPARWNNISRSERAALVVDVLRAYLELGAGRRETILLVVEPSLAALLFYGVARLLPAGKFRDDISFSTFEPDPDRAPTALAATTFYDPENADLKPEAYRRSGYVINTFRKKYSSAPLKSRGLYARMIVDKLVAAGPAGVDSLLGAFQAASPQTPDDLEALAEAHSVVPTLLDPQHAISDYRWRESPLAVAFLGNVVRHALSTEPSGSPRIKALATGPNSMVLLDLIATAPDAENASTVRHILRYLPVDRFPALLSSDRIALGHKADVLAGFIHKTQHFPENCPQLWNGGAPKGAKENGAAAPRLLAEVLARLDLQTLEKVQALVPPTYSAAYLIALVQASKIDASKQPMTVHVITAMDDNQLVRFLTGYGEEIRPYYPRPERKLAKRLRRFLDELPQRPGQFSERLAMLQAWSDFFDPAQNAKERLAAWANLYRDVQFLKTISPNASRDPGQGPAWAPYDAVGKRIATSLQQAMPIERYGGPDHALRKLNVLRELGHAVHGRDDFLPDVVWTAMREVFHGGLWNLSAAASGINTSIVTDDWKATKPANDDDDEDAGPTFWSELRTNPLLPVIGTALCVAILAIAFLLAWLHIQNSSDETATDGSAPAGASDDRSHADRMLDHRGRLDELQREVQRGRVPPQTPAAPPEGESQQPYHPAPDQDHNQPPPEQENHP